MSDPRIVPGLSVNYEGEGYTHGANKGCGVADLANKGVDNLGKQKPVFRIQQWSCFAMYLFVETEEYWVEIIRLGSWPRAFVDDGFRLNEEF